VTTGKSHAPNNLPNYLAADITDEKQLFQKLGNLAGVETVIHCAGLAHQFKAIDENDFFRVNVQGTENIAKLTAKINARHLILISTVSVYGETNSQKAVTETEKCHPKGGYGESKWQAEQKAEAICQENNIKLTVLRLTTVYGAGDVGNTLRLITMVDKSKFVWIGKGLNQKTLINIEDVAAACLLVVKRRHEGIYNLVESSYQMREIVQTTCDLLQKNHKFWYIPENLALNLAKVLEFITFGHSKTRKLSRTMQKWLSNDVFSGEHFKVVFGFEPSINLREGLQQEIEWYRKVKEK
jgi:nucleoside-diphosphate-sugar epimerase